MFKLNRVACIVIACSFFANNAVAQLFMGGETETSECESCMIGAPSQKYQQQTKRVFISKYPNIPYKNTFKNSSVESGESIEDESGSEVSAAEGAGALLLRH